MSCDEFEQRIEIFPSSFQLDIRILYTSVVNSVLERLLRELKEDEHTDCNEEIVRKKNLLSYLYWITGKRDVAFQYNEDALLKDENSVLGIANKAQFLHEENQYSFAEEWLDRLEKLKNHKLYGSFYRKAKAEIAYSYSRFGPRFHQKAEVEFEKVIKEEGDNYLWKFGLGLSLQRQLHIYNNPNYFNISHQEKFRKAVDVLWDVVSNTKDKNPVLCAKAWVEIGVLLYQKYKNYEKGIQSVELPKSVESLTYVACFENALKTSESDVFVLERAGKYFRYSKQFEKSETELRKAIQIKETSFAHHHLGLTLMKTAFHKYKRSHSFPPQPPQVGTTDSVRRNVFQDLEQDRFTTDLRQSKFDRPQSVALPDHTHGTGQPLYSIGHGAEEKTDDLNVTFENLSINTGRESGEHIRGNKNGRWSFRGNRRGRGSNRGRGNGQRNRDLPRRNENDGRVRGYERRGVQRRRPYGRSFSTSSMHQNVRAVINSPEKLKISPGNPKLEEAAVHFQKAVELSHGCNLRAQYHLGLTYRMLDRNEDALTAFKVITSQRGRSCIMSEPSQLQNQQLHNEPFSQMELVSAYEQQGLCLRKLGETCTDEEKRRYQHDSERLLVKAIEMASNAVAMLPSLKSAWNAFPTLRDLLVSKPNKDLKDFSELAKLHELMHEYGQSIEFYGEILNKNTDVSVKQKSYDAIAKNYVKLQDFDNAILFLNLLSCTGEGNQIDRQFYSDTYLSGALHALQIAEHEKSSERFQEVFRFCCPRDDDEAMEEAYDVHILADDHKASEVVHIEKLLSKYCQLKVTVNEREALPGRLKLPSTIATIKTSSCVVSVIHSPNLSHNTDYFINHVISLKKTLVIVNVEGVQVPDYLQTFPNISIDKIAEENIEHCNKRLLEQFFRALSQTRSRH